MSFYTSCPGFGALSPLRLPHDQPSVDLSVTLFRCVRLVGGGWTERIKVDPQLMSVARHLYERNILASPRTSPLCSTSACYHELLCHEAVGRPTPRCAGTAAGSAAHVWHRDVPEVQARWPLLSAWRWLVPTLDREVILSADTGANLRGNVTSPTAVFYLLHLVVPSSRQLGARLCRMMPCLTQLKALSSAQLAAEPAGY